MKNYGSSPVNSSFPLKGLWMLALILFAGFTLRGQVTSYTFSQSSGTYTPITGGTTLGMNTNDDDNFNNLPIGFYFFYKGVPYNTVGINNNGIVYFGGTATNSYSVISAGTANAVAGLNYDLQGNVANGNLQIKTIGTAPNRTFVAQWSNYRAYLTSNGDNFSFQIRLNETSNTIDIVYGSFTIANLRTAQVGLIGGSAADYNCREVINGLTTWATSTAGTSNFATSEVNPTLVPVSGQTFTWTPGPAPLPAANLTYTGVSTTGMTVNWDDNSTDEVNFYVFNSTDNLNFNLVSTVASTSTATTGTPYNTVVTGLSSSTTYYWRVYASNTIHTSTPPLSGSQATSPGTLCGTITIGPTGTYTSITAAIAAVQTNGLSCPVIFELQAAYVSTVETFPINIPVLPTTSVNTITCRPVLGATNLSITSNATQTIAFNGTNYFTFDGRPGGTGSVSQLTIDNTSTTGNACTFTNGTQYCGLNYIKVRGINTSTIGGVIAFGNATATTGNSNNSITNCDITSGATSAAVLIYAPNASATVRNSNNTVSNNVFYNWFLATGSDAAISMSGSNNAWTISNNSFYQTATRTYTSAVLHYAVFLNSTSSGTMTGGFIVTGNYFGGTAANCGGTAWTDAGAIGHRFVALQVTSGTYGVNEIQGNTFRNFNFSTTAATTTTNGNWCAINITGTGSSVNVGNTTPNVIGSTTANNQIVTSSTVSGGMIAGIYCSASGNVNISNNQIGGITANTSAATISSSVNGINVASGFPTISGNTIGSTTMTSSIITAANNSATAGQITGIISTTTLGAVIITNNTVMNLTNQYAGTTTAGQTRGIVTSGGMNTVSGNTVSTLANYNTGAGTTTTASVIGISMQSTSTPMTTGQNCFSNTVTNLANLGAAGNTQVNGILVTSSTTAGYQYNVYKNNISAIGAPVTSGTSITAGIQIYGGIGRIHNNMVVLGLDPLGSPVTANKEYDGIYKNTANRGTITFNTVSVTGSGVTAGTANTYAYRRINGPTTAPADSVYNNIFANTRSNGAGTGVHYAIQVNAITGTVENNNDFYGNGTGYQMGAVGATNYATLPLWIAATTFDGNSYASDPMFMSSTNLHINNVTQSVLESRGTTMNINFDYDNQLRPGPVGSVNGGGTAPDIGADEFDGIPVQVDAGVTALLEPSLTGCHTATDTIRVRIKNYANSALNMAVNNLSVTVNVTGPNPATFNLVISSGVIPAGGTLDTALSFTYNMTAVGTYTFNAFTAIGADPVFTNDAMAPVNITISAGTVVVSPNPNCEGSPTNMTVSGQTAGGSIQWQSSPDNITWTNIVGATTTPYSANPTDTTFYRSVSCGLHNSNSDTVNTIHVNPPTTVNDTVCGYGSVTLTAAGSGTLNWYTASTGGTPVASGTSYSPTINSTTTYYVENTFMSASAGSPVAPTCYPTYTSACSSADFINNVYTTGGITNISNLATGCNGTLPTNTTFFPTQIVTAAPGNSFTFFCQSGTSWSQGFRIWIDYNSDGDFADPGEDVLNFASSTALNSGVITIPAATAPGPKRMRVMCRFATLPTTTDYCVTSASFGETEEYTVMVSMLCASTRTAVTGVVTPPPAVTVTPGSTQLCGSDSTLIVAASANTGYTYTWGPATYLNTTSGDSVMFAPTTPGNYSYTMTAVDAALGCTVLDTINISSSLRPSFTLSTTDDSVCYGGPTQLNVAMPSSVVQVTNSNVLNTTTTYPAPYGNWYGGARHQMLILASELTSAGLTAGYIGGMQFQITNIGTSAPLQNFTIEMMPTAATSITTFQTGSFQTVYTNALYTPFVGVNTHNFSTPFYWDGVSNVIVQTCFNNLTFTQNCVFRQTATAFTSTVYYRNDNEPGVCSNTLVTASIAQRPNIAFLRSYASLAYSWTPAATLSAPTSDTTMAYPTATTMYYMTVTDTITGCSKTDSIQIVVLPTPMPNFGADTIICSNQPLTLDGTSGPYTYLWQDNSTNQTYSANVFGTYDVLVTDTTNGCTGTDTILVGVNAAPAFSLGSDVTVCAGTQVTFSGPSGQYSYDWNTLDSTVTITTGTAGSYDLMVTDTISGCFESDTVVLNVNPLPAVALGSDSTLCSINAPVILAAPAGNYTYLWSDMSTNDSLSVNASGTYYVTVTDTATTCFNGDTIMITVNTTPSVTLGNDSTQCGGNFTLTAPAGPYNYLWSDMSTGNTLLVSGTGSYNLTVTDSVTGCANSDTVNLTINAVPVVNLGADTSLCGGSLTLDAGFTTDGSYLWNDMSNAQTLVASASGQYYVAVTDTLTGCNASDSVNVTINTPPTVTFSIAQDTICTTDASLTLSGSPAGGTFSGPGVTGTTFNPATAGVGTHSITYDYTDANGCLGSVSDVIIVDPCVGVEESFQFAGMNVYPNPNNGMFTLTIGNANFVEMSVEIVTVDGKVIYSDMASNVQGTYVKDLNLTTYANGIYFLRVTADGQSFMQKVVKND